MFEAIKKYAVFSGRARRKEYWLFMLLYMIASVVAVGIDVGAAIYAGIEATVMTWILSLGLLIPTLAVSVRRLHDKNLRGWWLLLYPTGIGAIVILIFFCMR
jgi:uncharacterized membrane protein YhaH (DUF805 family)